MHGYTPPKWTGKREQSAGLFVSMKHFLLVKYKIVIHVYSYPAVHTGPIRIFPIAFFIRTVHEAFLISLNIRFVTFKSLACAYNFKDYSYTHTSVIYSLCPISFCLKMFSIVLYM